MSVDRTPEGWEGFQRHGQDIADRFSSVVQELGFLLQTHLRSSVDGSHIPAGSPYSFPFPDIQNYHQTWNWPWTMKKRPKRSSFNRVQFNINRRHVKAEPADDAFVSSPNPMISRVHELGQRIGHAGTELCSSAAGFLSDLGKHLLLPFQGASELDEFDQSGHRSGDHDEDSSSLKWIGAGKGYKQWKQRWHRDDGNASQWYQENDRLHDISDDELLSLFKKHQGLYRQGSINVTTTYESRTQEIGSSVTARGDLWRVEASSSHNGSQPAYGASPLFLLQIGPILFVRDSTLLLPIHLSKQHLLWYGYDRKNGVHSVCPAVWSKHRRWLLMSMICLNPLNCTFMDLQFPNGQLTYVAGEGMTSSLFFPLLGGFLQAQSHRPGATKLSFSKKMSWGTRVTPSIQFADKSFSLDVLQPLVWQRSGIMVRPAVEFRIAQTIGGRNAGWKAEMVHSPMEKISWSCGCALTIQPTAYASFSVGKSKRNGSDAGIAGLVLHVETPMENPRRASFFIRLNSCVEF